MNVAAPHMPLRDAPHVGAELRRLRRERGMTLDGVASATGLTKGYLSQLERDHVAPSLGSLARICGALGVRIGDVIEPPEEPVHRVERRPIDAPRGHHVLVSPPDERRFAAVETEIPPGSTEVDEPRSGSGQNQFVYVVKGALELVMDGQQKMILKAGDALTYSPDEPHSWRNPSRSTVAKVLFLALNPGPFFFL
jgi:transcriptional regulator with XRE-family HTH domain